MVVAENVEKKLTYAKKGTGRQKTGGHISDVMY
jgi:hypothetical protein